MQLFVNGNYLKFYPKVATKFNPLTLAICNLKWVSLVMAYQRQDEPPKLRSFSLGDFNDFERCAFSFFVKHHLEKKYELAEGNENQAVGSLLDLAIKKYHNLKQEQQSETILPALIRAAATQIKDEVEYNRSLGKEFSFYTSQMPYLSGDVIEKATQVLEKYYQGIGGKVKKAIHKNKLKPFWKYRYIGGEDLLASRQDFLLWGGGDAIELGDDGVAEVVDYKYYDNDSKSKEYLDLDQISKLYVLLASEELMSQGFRKARFIIRLWGEPGDESLYEEFDLTQMSGVADYFAAKVRKILGATSLAFCNNQWCKVCNHKNRTSWIGELGEKGWIKVGTGADLLM